MKTKNDVGLYSGMDELGGGDVAGAVVAPDELAALATEAGPDGDQPAATKQPPAPEVPAKVLLQPLLTLAFAKAAPAWKVTDAEVAELSDAWGALVDKWAPGGLLNKYGLELTALLVTVQVLAPRVGQPTQEPATTKKSDEAEERRDREIDAAIRPVTY